MSSNTVVDIFERESHNPSFETMKSKLNFNGKLVDYCVPVNNYFPPPEMLEKIKEGLPDILKYYPDYADAHQNNLSELIDVDPENIVVANGSTEIITLLCRDAEGPIVSPVPTFGRWTDLPFDFNVPVHFILRESNNDFQLDVDKLIAHVRRTNVKTLVFCNPNNPTGAWFDSNDIKKMLRELADIPLIVIDESFIDFSDLESAAQMALCTDNAIVVKSLGKSVGWHGIRLGYAVANQRLAHNLRRKMPYWNINGLASFVLKQMLEYRSRYFASFRLVERDRDYMAQQLGTIEHLKVYPSKANFLYCELPGEVSGKKLRNELARQYGLIVRECSNKVGSTETYLRIAVTKKNNTDRLVYALKKVLSEMFNIVPFLDSKYKIFRL